MIKRVKKFSCPNCGAKENVVCKYGIRYCGKCKRKLSDVSK